MEKFAFIGGYDKTDLILYIAKIFTALNKKVIVLDTTILQKTRYIVPTMVSTRQYVTTYENIDIAIGFESLAKVKEFQGLKPNEELKYDMALIDIDTARAYREYEIKPADKHYFVTSFDLYSLKKGLSVFAQNVDTINVTKVLFTKDMLGEENQYLNFLSKNFKIRWNSEIIFFPFDQGDQNVIYANQRLSKIRVRGLSMQYMDSLIFICEELSKLGQNEIKKALRIVEKN